MTHAYWGPSFTDTEFGALWPSAVPRSRPSIAASAASMTRKELVDITAPPSPTGWWSAGFKAGWNGAARARQSLDPWRSAPSDMKTYSTSRSNAGNPFVRSLPRSCGRPSTIGSARRRCAVHAPGFSRSARKAARQSPAVTQVDGTGRLQTVDRASNPRYCAHRGVRPVDRRADGPQHVFQRKRTRRVPSGRGIGLFLRTKMDVLVLGDCLVRRESDAV